MASDSKSGERPSRIRYVVLGLTTAVAVFLYLDRICLSIAERYVKEDLGLTNDQMADVIAAFFWAYALGQLPAGWLSDRFGARLMLAIFVAAWSVFTGLLAVAYTLVALIVMRLGCGLFEAGGYPAAAGLIGKWMPVQSRGFASGIVSMGGRLGGMVAPVLTAYLICAFVSISTSSLVEPDDLLDVSRLFPKPEQSTQSGELTPAAVRRLDVARTKAELAQRVSESLSVDVVAKVKGLTPLEANDNPDLRRRLASELSALVGQPGLIDGIPVASLDLEREARDLLARPVSALTREEVERRNRLVLEAAFPDAIRKLYYPGWRPVMLVYGIAGLIVACLFWVFFRDSPRQHARCNPAEIALIEGHAGTMGAPVKAAPLEFSCLLRSSSLWISSAVQLLTNFGWAFLITWLPRYLKEAHEVPLEDRGWMTAAPIAVGVFGMFGGGWLTDYSARRLGRRWGRSVPLALSRFVVMGAFVACLYLETPWEMTAAFAVVAFATDLGTPSIWAYSLDVGGKHVGSVLGWSNMFGNFGAALSPKILNELIGIDQTYKLMFITCAATFALAGVLALFLDSTKPVVPAEKVAA